MCNYSNRGWANTQLQRTDEGIADLEKSLELDPENYETHFRLANLYLRVLEDFEKAIESLGNTIKYYKPEESGDPDIFINGYLMRADAEMRLADEEDTSDERRAQLYQSVLDDTDAVLEEYPDQFPESGNALYVRGRALRMLLRYGEAIKTLTDAIQMVPGGEAPYLGEAFLKRGICWLSQEEPDLARKDFEQAASLNYEDPLPYFWVGLTHAQEEEYRKAIESYGDAIAKNPTQTSAYVNRGLAYLEEEDYDKAVENFNEAIRLEPTESEHFYKRGVAYMWLEEYEKAFNSFQLATLFNEKNAKAFRAGAIALNRLDRGNLASQYERTADELEAAQEK